MRKYYLLVGILLMSVMVQAQIINFPDPAFKYMLLNQTPSIDTNTDGEIEVSEAVVVTNLSLTSAGITSLEGIAAFTNLENLSCIDNQITTLDVSMLSNLTALNCSQNHLTFLLLSPSIQLLNCSQNQLPSIDLLVLTNLKGLSVAFNQLTSLVLPNSSFWDYSLDISGNLYTSVDLSPITNTGETSFTCYFSHLTSLTLPSTFLEVSILDNQDLTSLSLKNGVFDGCIPDPADGSGCSTFYFQVQDNPNLHYICVDDMEFYEGSEQSFFQSYFASIGAVVSSYCSFTPGGTYNAVTGLVGYDCTAGVPSQHVVITNGTDTGSTYTSWEGNYTFYPGIGSQTITPQLENPTFFNVTPPSYTFNFTTTGNTETANFCLTPNGVHPDLEVSIVPLSVARPGFDAHYKMVYKNKGNQVQSGSVVVTFDDGALDFVSASPATTTSATNTLTWDFSTLTPFESRAILFTLNVNGPTETPAVNIGDVLPYTVALNTTETDETPADNQMNYNQTVVGSYDPNDKTVLEGATISTSQIDDYLHYVVRFQNTGTFAAENIVVKDMLDANLDWSTLEMVSSSHPYRSALTQGNKLEVIYEGINLPPSATDEPGSHGYIAFKIKPKSTVVEADVIENTANIYFDYNFPIVTNTVATIVSNLGTPGFHQGKLFTVYPNPTNNNLNISLSDNDTITAVTICNALGQKVMNATTKTLDVSSLTSGTYFITVTTNKGKATQKIIKL